MKKSFAFFISFILVFCEAYSQNVAAFAACAGQTISLGADKTFCQGDSVTLNASGTFDRIVWSTGASTASIKVKTSGTYIVHGLKASTVDLITNGDFHDTLTTFSSDYLTANGNQPFNRIVNPNYFKIVPRTGDAYWDFDPNCADHTSGNGTSNMLGVNGYTSVNKKVWCQTVAVQPGKTYNLSAWATSMAAVGKSASNPAKLQFKINNTSVGTTLNLPNTQCSWQNMSTSWASGVAVSAQVCIYDNVFTNSGNDFAIDDITFTTADTCRVSDAIVVTVNPKPAVSLGNDISTCAASAVLTVPSAQPSWTYLWSNSSTTNPITVATNGTYSVDVTDANLCKASDAINVTFVSASKINLGNDTTFCAGGSKLLDAGVGYTNYTWTGAKTGSAQTLLADVAGTYYVSATGACSSKDTLVVTINAKPVVNLGTDISTCVTSVKLRAQPIHTAYLWSDATTDSTLTVGSSGAYWVEVSNVSNCKARDTINVALGSNLVIKLGADTTVCQGVSRILDAGTGFTSYVWKGAKTGSSQQMVANTAGTYYVTASNGACTARDTFMLSLNKNPKPLLGSDKIICLGAANTFNAGSYASYLWSDASTAPTLNTVTSGVYWVEVTDANSCKGRDTAVLTVQNTFSINLGADKMVCQGVFPLLDAGVGYTSYTWSGAKNGTGQTISGDVSGQYIVAVTTAGSCSASDTINVSFHSSPQVNLGDDTAVCATNTALLDAGIFPNYLWSTSETSQTVNKSVGTFWVTITDANYCSASDTIVVISLAKPQVNIGNDVSLCVGNTLTIQDNVGAGGLTYDWTAGGASLGTSSSLQITQSGTYTLTVTDANNCTNSDALAATFKTPPIVNLLNGKDSALVCKGNSQVLDASVNALGITYLWLPGKENTATISVKNTGVYVVIVSDGLCNDTDAVQVQAVEMPKSVLNDSLNPNTSNYCFVEELAGVNISAAMNDLVPYNYLWSTGATTPAINVIQEGTYSVTLSLANCSVKDNLKLIDYCATTIYLPSAFSPNGDGVNETFSARGTYVDDYKILIFNRWGELIYSSNNFTDSWDGTYAGVKVQEDVYVWKILYKEHEKSGVDSVKQMMGKVVVLR